MRTAADVPTPVGAQPLWRRLPLPVETVASTARFVITGLVAFGLDLGGLILTHGELGWPLRWALPVCYGVAGTVHYALTRYWVFPPADPRGGRGRVARYLTLGVSNMVLTTAIVLGLVAAGTDYRIAKVLAVGTLFLANLFIMPRWVMRAAPARP